MQNVFELSWSWYEDYVSFLFFHPSKTEEEFNSDVKNLFIKYGDEYLKSQKNNSSGMNNFVGMDSWVEFIATKLPELGYIEVQTKKFDVFGGYIIKKENGHNKTEIEQIINLIGGDLYIKAIEHNKKIDAEI